MTKLRREHGAARQLGAINNILRPQSHTQRPSKSVSRTRPNVDRERSQEPRGRAQIGGQAGRPSQPSQRSNLQDRITRDKQSRQTSQMSSRSRQTPFRRGDQRRSCSPQQAPRDHSNRSHQRVKGHQNGQRRSHSPQQKQSGDSDGMQRKVSMPVEAHSESTTASMITDSVGNINQSSSDKRKRSTIDKSSNEGREPANKKHQIARPDALRPDKPLRRVLADQRNSVAKTEAVLLIPIIKSPHHSAPKAQTQLPSPPCSNATPEHERQTREHEMTSRNLQQDVATPTPEKKFQEEQRIPRSTSTTLKHNKKRQRGETGDTEVAPKRLRLSKAVKPTRLQRTPPAQHPQAHAVRPESSFAPVAPNPECDLKLLEYDHDSVPVLYSTKIKHTNSTELLNCPPEQLVFDALDAIEAGFKPYSKYGWPTALGVLGRTPSKDNPTRVLDDVDLYLHEMTGKLHVATDRGLIIVTDYLKLIGVPETQPVRFDGRIPPWAKAALHAREKRRVVQIWGKDKKTEKGKQLEDHQVAVKTQRNSRTLDEEVRQAEVKDAPRAIGAVETAVEQKVEKEEILEVEPGDLPLPLGSSVIVYKIDSDDLWAYGRLCGINKKGWFPISHTCPVDWSLDRFTGSSADQIDKPFPKSSDPEWKDWNGLAHWIRQEGYPEGPTWKETCAANASAAAQARADAMSKRSSNAGHKAVEPTAEQSPMTVVFSVGSPSEKGKQSLATAREATANSSTATNTTWAETTTDASITAIAKNAKKTEVAEVNTGDREDSAQPAGDIWNNPVQVRSLLEGKQEASSGVDIGTTTAVFSGEEREAVGRNDAQEPEVPERHEKDEVDAETATAPAQRDPFTVPRYDPFARNDDIEYDWNESDDEEL